DSAYTAGGPLSASNPGGALWDIIVNFQQGYDKLDFSAVQLTGADAPQHLVWEGVTSTDANAGIANADRDYAVWYETNRKFVYVDTNGDGAADMKIQGPTVLDVHDFIGVIDDSDYDNDGLGKSGNDTISDPAPATVCGGAGNDSITMSGNTVTAFGGSGADTIIGSNLASDSIYAGSGSDSVLGNLFNDTVFGGAGNDTINGGGGTDLL